MIDETQHEILFRYLDDESSEHENQQLEKMLTASSELRSLKVDLLDIRRNARLQNIQCPSHLEHKITSKLEEIYPPRPQKNWLTRVTTYPLRIAAAIVILVGTASFFYPTLNREVSNQALTERSVEQVLGDVIFAQDQYRSAIVELESLAMVRLEQLPRNLAAVFVENLEIVDEAIALYEAKLESTNADSFSYYTLSDIYDAKIELLMTILDV